MGVSRSNGRGVSRAPLRRQWPDRAKLNLEHGIRNGYRSGLEERNAKFLQAKGVKVSFETLKVKYKIPESNHTYTPDFLLPNGIVVETKGKLEAKDRAKHIYVKQQRPDLDIRFVFHRANDPIYKGSPTTCAAWAEKNGFKWAAKLIPEAWLHEPGPEAKPWDQQS